MAASSSAVGSTRTRSSSAGQDAACSRYIEGAAAMVPEESWLADRRLFQCRQIAKFATEIIETGGEGRGIQPTVVDLASSSDA